MARCQCPTPCVGSFTSLVDMSCFVFFGHVGTSTTPTSSLYGFDGAQHREGGLLSRCGVTWPRYTHHYYHWRQALSQGLGAVNCQPDPGSSDGRALSGQQGLTVHGWSVPEAWILKARTSSSSSSILCQTSCTFSCLHRSILSVSP